MSYPGVQWCGEEGAQRSRPGQQAQEQGEPQGRWWSSEIQSQEEEEEKEGARKKGRK